MEAWIRFDQQHPSQGQFIATITQRDVDLTIEDWERDLEKNAIGTWVDGEVWEGNVPRRGFTHWMPLPDRPLGRAASPQLSLWDLLIEDKSPLEP
jgi:Protein of unknown function (DUF551)